MAIQEVIKYEGDNSTLIYKHPAEDFNTLSQLIVHESQEAVFFSDGQALDSFKAGRYTLETKNIPLISKIRNLVSGGVSPFHVEVYFINLATMMDIAWGTPSQDLKKTIEKINLTATVAGGSGRDGLDNRYKNAMTLLNQGNISTAKAEFTGIRNDFMWSCKGYYGLILCEKKKKHINWGEIGDYIQQIYRCEDVTPEILQEMEGILNDGRQIALASLGKSLNERNAQQNEISSKIQQVTEMSKLQENTLTRKKEEFAERWSQTSPVRKAISIAIGIICALVLVWCAVSLFRWIVDVKYLFANAMNYGFFAGILRILWSCVRTILRVAVSVGVIILGILIYFVILGFITANPQKDDAQLNIDKMDEQIQKLQERHEILQRRFDEEQMNIQNINRIGSRLEQLQQIKPEEIIPLLIEAGKYY